MRALGPTSALDLIPFHTHTDTLWTPIKHQLHGDARLLRYCADCGGYKIETVGDCYVASFGIVGGTGTAQASAINAIEMGLRLVEMSVQALRTICEDEQINVRVGVHTGVVCSGIIKSDRPRWQVCCKRLPS